MGLIKANDRRTSCPCHDEFRGPRSDCVRQVALENNNYPSLACPFPRFVPNGVYLGSFGMARWASHKFERTRGKVTANMERNVLKTSYRPFMPQCPIVSHRAFVLEGVQQGIKSSVL
ncbi:uncharacterized protein TNCV_3298981 [Trichonephila clavipes]|uniref:Uncharacterized protein n=1 Tax=Trichonephila clavipes TaxID=2585209 RepID=A0A8X6VTN9_TRICX|nr:uncharacterized protein TNCV_3298981 [Trichonephila clavipes]